MSAWGRVVPAFLVFQGEGAAEDTNVRSLYEARNEHDRAPPRHPSGVCRRRPDRPETSGSLRVRFPRWWDSREERDPCPRRGILRTPGADRRKHRARRGRATARTRLRRQSPLGRPTGRDGHQSRDGALVSDPRLSSCSRSRVASSKPPQLLEIGETAFDCRAIFSNQPELPVAREAGAGEIGRGDDRPARSENVELGMKAADTADGGTCIEQQSQGRRYRSRRRRNRQD